MTQDNFKLTVHMVSSLDGVIAKKDNSVSWFDTPDHFENGADGEDSEQFLKTIDCYVMGARTYQHALELSKSYGWPYGNVPTIVVTHKNLTSERKNIEFYSGDLDTLVNARLKPKYKNAWLVGGAILARQFLQQKLVHEIRLTIIPIILGEGLYFLKTLEQELPLHLTDLKGYKNGLVELRYEIRK